jgi:8-oxo-dGTP pyrophosphatase MutT (NUDIX family)
MGAGGAGEFPAMAAAVRPRIEQVATLGVRSLPFGEAEFLLLETGKGGWQFPTVSIDEGDAPAEKAVALAVEEAGVRGRILVPPVHTYRVSRDRRAYQISVYLLHVTEVLTRWPLMAHRRRRWIATHELPALKFQRSAGAAIRRALHTVATSIEFRD